MLIKNEKQLLDFVKYSPVIIIVVIAIIVNGLFFVQNRLNYEKDLKLYEQNYIETNKTLIKDQIESIYLNIQNEKKKLENDLKNELKARLNEVYSVIDNINKEFSNESDEKVLKIIKETLRGLRFNDGRGYFYIHDANGKNIMHPIYPELEGKDLKKLKDKNNFYFIKELVEKMKTNQEYFLSYYWYKPNQNKNKVYKKISINKKYEPLNLIIGTGEYIDNFESKVKEYILNEYIQKMSFGKNSYVFITDYNGVYLAHVKKSYIGKNRINLTDKNGFEITKQIIETAKNGSGYIRYIGTVIPETGMPASKTTYIKGLADWKWAIGTGFYDKDLQRYLLKKKKELEYINSETLKKTITISFVLTIILIIIALYISKILKQFFDSYNEKIYKEVSLNRKKDSILYQQAKMASMGEMIGNIAHQWRQPLNMISTAASKMKFEEEMGILTKESQSNSIDNIMKSTKYLSETIEDFRHFFNPDKIAKEFSTLHLFDKTMQLVSPRITTKNISVINNIENILIIGFENELIQVLINIFNNSIDALDSIDDEKFIIVNMKTIYEKNEKHLKISIKDNAGGIDETIISKIFEAYFTTKHKSQGTGIGLYMSYQIITKHFLGEISVKNSEYIFKNNVCKGAEFLISLPIKD